MPRKINFGNTGSLSYKSNNILQCDSKRKIIEVKNEEEIKTYLTNKYQKNNFNLNIVAKELGISYEFLRQRIHNGQIPAIKYGRRIVISEKVFIQLLKEGIE